MPMDVMATTTIVQDITTAIVTKIMTGMVDTAIITTMEDIIEIIITTVDTADRVMIRIDIEHRASILVLVDMETTFVMAMGASKVSSSVVVAE